MLGPPSPQPPNTAHAAIVMVLVILLLTGVLLTLANDNATSRTTLVFLNLPLLTT